MNKIKNRTIMTMAIAIVLAMVMGITLPQVYAQQKLITMNGGTCLGLQTSPTFYKFIKMSDGSMVLNKDWTLGAFTISADVLYANDPYVDSPRV